MKNKTIGKITAGILVVGATFFGISTSSITLLESDSINNSNLTTYKSNKADDAAINTLKSKGTITQTSMSPHTSSAVVYGSDNKYHLWMWGKDDYSQQGDGVKHKEVETPTEVTKLNKFLNGGEKITQISMSSDTSSAVVHGLDNKDHLYMWGANASSQQGDGKTENVETPTEVKFDKDVKKITQISMSEWTSSALVLDDKSKTHLYMWGADNWGQQGDRKNNNVTTPKEVKFDTDESVTVAKITQISMSGLTSSALVLDDKSKTHLYMWGNNSSSQQGDVKDKAINTPKEVKFDSNVKNITQISMSSWTSSALVLDNNSKTHLYMWGYNRHGQQGDGTTKTEKKPTEVQFFEPLIKKGATITQISMSEYTSSALVLDNNSKTHLYMWGANDYGQQGNNDQGKDKKIKTPIKVNLDNNVKNITQISMSAYTSSALVLDNNSKTTHIYMWGANDTGQQGHKTKTTGNNVITPTEALTFDSELKDVKATILKTTQIGDKKLSIKFKLEQENNPSKKDVKVSKLWITCDLGKPKEIKYGSWGDYTAEISELIPGKHSYAIHVKYHAVDKPEWEVLDKVVANGAFTIQQLKEVKAIDAKATQIGDDKVSIDFDLEQEKSSLKKDVEVSKLWITDDSGKETEILNEDWGNHKKEISGVSSGAHTYIIHVKYHASGEPRWKVLDNEIAKVKFEIQELKEVEATNVKATQIGDDKVSIDFDLEQEKLKTKKDVELSEVWITTPGDVWGVYTTKIKNKGLGNYHVESIKHGYTHKYSIHVKYHAIGKPEWEVPDKEVVKDASFTIQELKTVEATGVNSRQIGNSKVSIDFNLNKEETKTKKDVELSEVWITDDSGKKITEFSKKDWGKYNVVIDGISSGNHTYTIHAKYHAVGEERWEVPNNELGTTSFSIKLLKNVQATSVTTKRIGDGKVLIDFDLEPENNSSKRDIVVSKLWITDDSGHKIEIKDKRWGKHKVKISGLDYGTYSKYTIHVKYEDPHYPNGFGIREKSFKIPSFAMPFSHHQIVWISLSVSFVILSGLTIFCINRYIIFWKK